MAGLHSKILGRQTSSVQFSFSCSFMGKNWPNNRLAPAFLLGLVSYLGNNRSAADHTGGSRICRAWEGIRPGGCREGAKLCFPEKTAWNWQVFGQESEVRPMSSWFLSITPLCLLYSILQSHFIYIIYVVGWWRFFLPKYEQLSPTRENSSNAIVCSVRRRSYPTSNNTCWTQNVSFLLAHCLL